LVSVTDDLVNVSPCWETVIVAAACAPTMTPIKQAMAVARGRRTGMAILASEWGDRPGFRI
jgi:hypothetical protein